MMWNHDFLVSLDNLIRSLNDKTFPYNICGIDENHIVVYHAGPIDIAVENSFMDSILKRENALHLPAETYRKLNPFSDADKILMYLLALEQDSLGFPPIPQNEEFYFAKDQLTLEGWAIENREQILRNALWSIDEYFVKRSDVVVADLINVHSIGTYVEIVDAMLLGKQVVLLLDDDSPIENDPFIELVKQYALQTLYHRNQEKSIIYHNTSDSIVHGDVSRKPPLSTNQILDACNFDDQQNLVQSNGNLVFPIQDANGLPIPHAIAALHCLYVAGEHVKAAVQFPYASHTYLRAKKIPRLALNQTYHAP